jgi:organic radical activating enzyme
MNIGVLFATDKTIGYCNLIECEKFYIIVENPYEWNFYEEDADVIYLPLEDAINLYNQGEIDKFLIFPTYKKNMRMVIHNLLGKIKSTDIMYIPMKILRDKTLTLSEQKKLVCIFDERDEIDYLAVHLSEQCNLKCRYCSMMIGAGSGNKDVSFDKTKAALIKLRKAVSDIGVIQIMGGEPLLNAEILSFCSLLRELYKFTKIEIVTNGILIPTKDSEFFEVIKKFNIKICVSHYPILGSKADVINSILKREGVMYEFSEEFNSFLKLYNFEGDSDIDMTFRNCVTTQNCKNGFNLKEYLLAGCMAPFALNNVTNYCNINPLKYKIIDLMNDEDSLSIEKILELSNEPAEICRYCHHDNIEKWMQAKEIDDISNWSI